jgi:hypothetical protein
MKNLIKVTLVISLFLLSGIGNFALALDFQLNGSNQTWMAENVGVEATGLVHVASLTENKSILKIIEVTNEGTKEIEIGYSYFFTAVNLLPGTYVFSFDFRVAIPQPAEGNFSDGFYVSLYFNNFDPDPNIPLGSNIPVLDVNGPFSSNNWLIITLPFDIASTQDVFPVFQLFDLSGIMGDSTIEVKNVYLSTPVPEPSSMMFLCAGILGLGLLLLTQRRKAENFKTFV